MVDRAIKNGVVVEASFARAANGDPLYALAEELAQPIPIADEVVRIIPPLDNLLFNRRRLTELFGFAYKFEAYTPQHQRRFYFAMPILHGHDVAGLIDAKKDGDGVARGRARPHQESAGGSPAPGHPPPRPHRRRDQGGGAGLDAGAPAQGDQRQDRAS